MLLTPLTCALLQGLPTVLLRQGEAIPGGPPGQLVSQVLGVATHAAGGHACLARTSGPLGSLDVLYGARGAGPRAALRSEATHAGLQQVNYDSRFALAAATEVYSGDSVDIGSGLAGIDALWRGDIPAAVERTPAVFPGSAGFWASIDEVSATLDGRAFFRAGLAAAAGGAVVQRGLFELAPGAAAPSPLFLGGANPPGWPAALHTTGVRTAAVSSVGGRVLAHVALASAGNTSALLVLDGAPLTTQGALVREGELVPGGLGDRWDDFTWLCVNGAGQWAFAGDTQSISTAFDDVLWRESGLYLREGQARAGGVLSGPVRAAALNERGELAYVWGVTTGGVSQDVLFLEAQPVLRIGDTVDWDGDGALDPAVTLVSLRAGALAIGSLGELYVAGAFDVAGQIREGFLLVPRAFGSASCAAVPNSSGAAAAIGALGSPTLSAQDLSLRCTGMPRFGFGFFLTSRALGFVAHPGGSAGNLCLGGAIGRFQQQVQNTGAGGVIQIAVDLAALPLPTGAVPALPGETWHFTTWFRDVTPGGLTTSNFSNALSVTFE